MRYSVQITNAFRRDLKGLSEEDKGAVIKALKAFIGDPRSHGLNFEKVTGQKGYATIRATLGVRILMRQITKSRFDVVAIGNHDFIYRSYFKNR